MDLKRKMSDKHEEFLEEVFGLSRRTPGSGNQAANPMDVRQSRYELEIAFAIDGKSTRGDSISVTVGMLTKAREQAHGERPMLALRFYKNDRLTDYEDWFLMDADDFGEIMNSRDEGWRLVKEMQDP